MKDQLISFPTAKLAKEKGFNFKQKKSWCNYYEGEPIMKWKLIPLNKPAIASMEYNAPTQALLCAWLREVHNIHVSSHPTFIGGKWYPKAINLDNPNDDILAGRIFDIHRDTYELSLELGLQTVLKYYVHQKSNKNEK